MFKVNNHGGNIYLSWLEQNIITAEFQAQTEAVDCPANCKYIYLQLLSLSPQELRPKSSHKVVHLSPFHRGGGGSIWVASVLSTRIIRPCFKLKLFYWRLSRICKILNQWQYQFNLYDVPQQSLQTWEILEPSLCLKTSALSKLLDDWKKGKISVIFDQIFTRFYIWDWDQILVSFIYELRNKGPGHLLAVIERYKAILPQIHIRIVLPFKQRPCCSGDVSEVSDSLCCFRTVPDFSWTNLFPQCLFSHQYCPPLYYEN